ncbi:MAG: cytochrome c oxidase assembly protein [Puniceicoccaceae bacterium]|nr:MAG: cytochrome c oxidase assembly protein [Puniceicoccaceae bacterium]
MQLHWHTEPLLLITLLGVGWLYALAVGPFRASISDGARFPLRQCILFYLGLTMTYLAVGSPLDQIGEQFLFFAHMIQHMLLIYCCAPLFIFGTPSWLIDWLLKPASVTKVMRVLTHPACAGLLFTFVYTVWHVPVLYEAALHDKRIHVLEHWTMFGLALLMLWPSLTNSTRIPRRSHGVRMLTVFLLMVGQLPVFAFLCFSGEPLYPTYEWAPRIIELDPLNDQVLGGIIMKVVNMGFSLTLLGTIFYQWAKKDAADDPVPMAPRVDGLAYSPET